MSKNQRETERKRKHGGSFFSRSKSLRSKKKYKRPSEQEHKSKVIIPSKMTGADK